MTRKLQDALLTVSKAMANADAVVNTDPLDLGSVTPFPVTESIAAKIATTAATGVNTKIITIKVQHSDESDDNFTDVAELASLNITAATNAYAATERTVPLPPSIKRYVRLTQTGEDGGGNASNGTVSLTLLF
jgi:hypothetical protein